MQRLLQLTIIILILTLQTMLYAENQSPTPQHFDLSKFERGKINTTPIPELVNYNFEQQQAGWQLPNEYSIAKHSGRSGTDCLKLTRTDLKSYQLASQTLKLVPGKRYQFGIWIKTANIQGKDLGASLCLEFYGKGKYISGEYLNGITGTKDWTLISGSKTVPAGTDKTIIVPYLRRRMTGTAWFDDLFIRPENSFKWSIYQTTPALNAVTENNGRLELAISNAGGSIMNRAPQGMLYCQIDIQNSKKSIVVPVKNSRAKFNLGRLKPGDYKLTVSVIDIKAKTILSHTMLPLKVFAANRTEPPNSCLVDAAGRTVVNGKYFMPIGIYTYSASKSNIDTIAAGGFNCLLPYGSMSLSLKSTAPRSLANIKQALDYCHQQQLKVIFSIKDVFPGTRWAITKWLGAQGADKVIRQVIAQLKSHPAILAWYINDELPIYMLDKLINRRRLVNKLDPNHPTWSVLYQFSELPIYGATCDIIGVDPYPIENSKSHSMQLVNQAMQKAEFTGLPTWSVLQLFNYAVYKPQEDAKLYRSPTEEELRSMTLLSVAKGVKGFFFYMFEELKSKKLPKDNFSKNWPQICRVVKMLKELKPFIMADYPPELLQLKNVTGKVIAVRLRDNNKKSVIIICGIGPGKCSAELTVEPQQKYSSKFGATTPKKQQWIFKGNNICSDILQQQ